MSRIKKLFMARCWKDKFDFAVTLNLLACGVLARTPVPPLARHRDVVTTQGPVRGYFSPYPPHYAYLGIPYARPPTKYARFKAPEPPIPWNGIFEAIHRIKCPQPDGSGEENCLVVNVFVPEHASSEPVIVYFHDGDFQRGWGFYDNPRKLLEQGFVFVTFNYRLGALGFLCLGLEEITGNAGLKDQVAALYWVNKNIGRFQGDPLDITSYGTGSGAVSIELLLLSGLIKDLIHKVILDSGSALSPSSISHEPLLNAFTFARDLGFNQDSDLVALQEFYYEVSCDRISNSSTFFMPCVEDELFTNSLLDKDPRDYLKSGKFQHVPMMIIYTNAKETTIIADNPHRFNIKPYSFGNMLPNNLVFDNEDTRSIVAEMVKNFYFDDLELTNSVIQSYVTYINDIFMEYPIVKSAAHHANYQTVFLMKFLYTGKETSDKYKNLPEATGGDVTEYIFSTNELRDHDEMIAARLITIWSNFIKLGDPTPLTSLLIPEVWQPLLPHVVDSKIVLRNIPYLMFGSTMKNRLLSGHQLDFWDGIYDKFYKHL